MGLLPIVAFVITLIINIMSAIVDGQNVPATVLASRWAMGWLLLSVKNEYVRRRCWFRLVRAARRVAESPALPRRGLFSILKTLHAAWMGICSR